MGVCKAALSEILRALWVVTIGRAWSSLPFGDLVKLIAMEVGENHQIKRRQLIASIEGYVSRVGVQP